MAKLTLNDNMITSLVGEVGPLVSSVTGWDLGLDSLGSRVLPKNQGYEEILLGRIQAIGVHGWQDMMPGFLERMLEYLIEENALAAYMPGAGEILVLRENVDDSNLDGLKIILGHELAHRGQHIAHADLYARIDELLKQVFDEILTPSSDLQRMRANFDQIQPIMTLLESHAAYVQNQLKARYFPSARIESHFNIATLLMRLVGAPKVAQYSAGLPQVNAAMAAGSIDALFRSF